MSGTDFIARAKEHFRAKAADAEATMQDPGNASILRCSDSDVEPDAATEHIAPASYGSAGEASSGCGDMTIESIDDVVSKLSSDCDESAAALRNAVQTLQRGVQAEIRNLCKPWGVQLTAKNDNGKYSKRASAVLKSELKDTFIAKAKEHFRAKATENQPLQHALTEHTTAIQLKKGTEAPASSAATEHAETEFHIDSDRSHQDSFPIESEANTVRLKNYQNVFDSPVAAIDLITWARAHNVSRRIGLAGGV